MTAAPAWATLLAPPARTISIWTPITLCIHGHGRLELDFWFCDKVADASRLPSESPTPQFFCIRERPCAKIARFDAWPEATCHQARRKLRHVERRMKPMTPGTGHASSLM